MKTKPLILTGLGFFLLGLGAIGLLLPVWPTTPFILAAAACFSGSPRLRAWIMKNPYFREYIENYESRNGLSSRTVIMSLCFLWGMLVLSSLLTRTLWVILLLLAVGIAVTGHVLWMARAKNVKKRCAVETNIGNN